MALGSFSEVLLCYIAIVYHLGEQCDGVVPWFLLLLLIIIPVIILAIYCIRRVRQRRKNRRPPPTLPGKDDLDYRPRSVRRGSKKGSHRVRIHMSPTSLY